MSFLTPLYILGVLAISLPVLFHLVRRMPRGRQAFGSLMFLSPSPPKLTRRSRLDNLLLLLLRAMALGLLVLAFARPFLRAMTQLGTVAPASRKIALVIDTSASMQRSDLWQQAQAEARQVLAEMGPGDDAALFAFDRDVRTLVAFDDAPAVDPASKIARLETALADLEPGTGSTDLGGALAAAADALADAGHGGRQEGSVVTRVVVLVSDLQSGSRLAGLEGFTWPDDVRLAFRSVSPLDPSNAGVHLAAATAEAPEDDRSLRVRVTNDDQSLVEQFQLDWASAEGESLGREPIDVYVPAGETRVAEVPCPAGDATPLQLQLTGDGHPFDNMLYVVPLGKQRVHVLYLGADEADEPEGLRYYLDRAFPETPGRKVSVTAGDPGEPIAPDRLESAHLVVVGQSTPGEQVAGLKSYAESGGNVLYVLVDTDTAAGLPDLLETEKLGIEEASVSDYTMLVKIDFGHPFFAPFADPRFSDFTKIHFWKHRRVELEGVSGVVVPARFDDGDPAIFERSLGRGRVVVFAAGWHPADSQLARSSKFVPLLSEVLARAGGGEAVRPQYEVGDRVSVVTAGESSGTIRVRKPDGSDVELAPGTTWFDQTDLPGTYRILDAGSQRLFAVNLAAAETKTAPLGADEFAGRGVRLGKHESRAVLAERQRQMRDTELESRQKLWQWLVAAALVVLIFETYLAGRLARQPAELSEATP